MHHSRITFTLKLTVGQCSVFCRSTFNKNVGSKICSFRAAFQAAASLNFYATIDGSGVEAQGLRF